MKIIIKQTKIQTKTIKAIYNYKFYYKDIGLNI